MGEMKRPSLVSILLLNILLIWYLYQIPTRDAPQNISA